MPSLEETLRAFDDDGFVNAGPVLEPSEVEELRAELERYVDRLFRGASNDVNFAARDGIHSFLVHYDLSKDRARSHFQMGGLWQVSDPFLKLVKNPRMAEIAAALARARTMQVWCDTVQYKPPGHGAPFHWHQDAPYHTSIIPAERLIGAWVALDDADEESGCMWMVPGSHRWGVQEGHLMNLKPPGEPDELVPARPPANAPQIASAWREPVPCRVKAGEVHFHHALMWHGSLANRGERPRRAYTIFYMPDGTRVSSVFDARIALEAGTLMTEAGAGFPIVYRSAS